MFVPSNLANMFYLLTTTYPKRNKSLLKTYIAYIVDQHQRLKLVSIGLSPDMSTKADCMGCGYGAVV